MNITVKALPDIEGWQVDGYLQVSGREAPLRLHVTATPEDQHWRIRATGRLDRHDTKLKRLPGYAIGRWISVAVDALMTSEQGRPHRHHTKGDRP